MAIPSFPSQDLAKLVLGYLAEEQLMTAYDEFLQASPYLDALRNEYDRMFMMSLKNILAEYRAVKISVETCRPFVLRKRLFQCSNLLEVVKFLINYVDINKLQALDANEKPSLEKQNISVKFNCEVCNSLKLPSCVCKRPQALSVSHDSEIEASSSQSSIEATALADLPGNYGTNRKKHVKTLEKDSSSYYSNSNAQQGDVNGEDSNSSCAGEQILPSHSISRNDSTLCMNSVKATESKESRPKIEEFNDVFESVVKRNSTISESQAVPSHKLPNANTFREFESGVSATDRNNANVPDSSTSENLNVQSLTKDFYNENMRVAPQCQLLLQVSNVNDNIEIQTCRGTSTLPTLLPKTDEQKIKILSDVKVGRKLGDEKKPLQFKNATSTPLMQMQTIVINGTPAYKQSAVNAYTKDEIMAMPTLIVVPPTGSSKNSTKSHGKAKPSVSLKNLAVNIGSPSSVLGPLVIDVPNSPGVQKKPNATSDLNMPNISSSNLIKTVDQIKNATAPKDNGATTTVSTNTPQGLPPIRKSSSTPRRTSHVRVLDFTTPRRILHETISEQVTSESTENAVEVVLSGSPSITNTLITNNSVKSSEHTIITYENSSIQNIECIQIDDEPTTSNVTGNIVMRKGNRNWDEDLRALAVAGDVTAQNKPKPKKSKKKKDKTSESNKEKTIRKQITPKGKKTKRKRKFEEDDDEPTPDPNRKPEVPVKPNINIISAYSEETISKRVTETVSNKTDEKEEDYTETPEGDRLLLQNVIGAKLNISDLLETPYKQALYDIQMGTPRFLGPDLPGDPMSDIKIMNIPTPRFLNIPKLCQATPGSYPSRPTDYSSSGSYYKPDDQDYVLIPDLNIPVTSSNEEKSNTKTEEKECDTKKSRPVRQCTKNISYKSSGAGKSKRIEDNTDTSSSCSESVGLNSTNDSKSEKENVLKTPVNNKSRSRVLSESNKKATVKKRQPLSAKDKSKTIIKVKSRQTPTKLTTSGRRKVSDISKFPSPHKLARNLTLNKDKHVNVQPLVTFPPTKSRRKSSSPRKLHRSKTPNSSNLRTSSPDTQKPNIPSANSHDSDTEQLALRWSDDGSQDAKAKDLSTNLSTQESEEISQIKEYIQTTQTTDSSIRKDGEGSLQADLIRRGFDVETAKIIERDLLDTPPQADMINRTQVSVEIVQAKMSPHEKTVETDVSSVNNELQIVQEDDDEDIVELSVHECNEDTANYFSCQHDYTKEVQQTSPITLRDNFTIELCMDEDLTVRLRANTFSMILDQGPVAVDETDLLIAKETEMAVRSISMFTPIKDTIKAQCFEIFDSTLTSLDTPLKPTSPGRTEFETESTVTDVVLEEEKNESKEKSDTKKRKRGVPDDSAVDKKKSKHDPQYLFTSTNIQNIDIETVLKKLHGPT